MECNNTYWQVSDNAWLKNRKEQWRQIKYNLDAMVAHDPKFKRKHIKAHKNLFFNGLITIDGNEYSSLELEKENQGLSFGLEEFQFFDALFYIWYHPQPETINFDQLRKNCLKNMDVSKYRGAFFSRTFSWPGNFPSKKYYNSYYGMMGGREQLCINFLCPSLNYMDILEIDIGWGGPKKIQLCNAPSTITDKCLFDTRIELYQDARFKPYSPGQYLWDHFSYALDKYPDKCFPDNPRNREYRYESLDAIIAEVLTFRDRTDTSRNRVSTVKLVNNLLQKYESREFSDPLLEIWDKAKCNIPAIKEREPNSFCWSYEEISNRLGAGDIVTDEEQQKRISEWELVKD